MTALLPLGLCWIGGAVFLLLDGRRPAAACAAVAVLAAATAADLVLLFDMQGYDGGNFTVVTGGWPIGVGIRLHVDGMSLFFGAICAGVLTAVMLHEARARVGSPSFPALLLLMCAGLHGAFFTGDLFNFYVFFEVSVVASFGLAAYGYGREEVRGAFVYIGANLLGSVLFLVGIAVVYHSTGVLDLVQLAGPNPQTGQAGIPPLGAALMFAALTLKLGLFPLHGWVPVIYSHAHPAVAAALSGALINIGTYGLVRIGLGSAEPVRAEATLLLAGLGSVAVVYGALLAARRRTPSEIIAYASIAQAGYVLVAMSAGGRTGAVAAMFVALAGSIEKAAMFLCQQSAGAARTTSALVGACGVAGLPLTLGFFAKIELLRASLASDWSVLLTGSLVVGTLFLFVAAARYCRQVDALPVPERRNGAASLGLAGASVGLALAAAPVDALILRLGDGFANGGAG